MDDEQKEKVAEIERQLRERMYGRSEQPEEDQGDLDERQILMRDIDLRRAKEAREDEANSRLAADIAEDEYNQALEDEAQRLWEEEAEDEENLMDPETILYNFAELDPDENGFSDVWQNAEIRRPLIDAIDVAIGEEGRDPNDWRIYEKIGNQFRERLQALEANPELETIYKRQDAEARIQAKRIREMAVDNEYYERSLLRVEPETGEELVGQFVQDFPDVAGDPKSYGDAVAHVNRAQVASHIDTNQIRTDYGLYQDAGQRARTRNALRELAEARGQNPDDI